MRYEITQAMCFCVLRLVSGHDSDGGFQHEEDNEGEGHHQTLGHWGTAKVVLCT